MPYATPLGGTSTLPSWGMMNPFFIQPDENLLISSEDVKCFFYTMSVPACWVKFLAFNKPVPQECLPESLEGRCVYLASQPVLAVLTLWLYLAMCKTGATKPRWFVCLKL